MGVLRAAERIRAAPAQSGAGGVGGRRAARRPPSTRVIVPMCSVPGRIPWGAAAHRRPLESLSGCSSNQSENKHTGE